MSGNKDIALQAIQEMFVDAEPGADRWTGDNSAGELRFVLNRQPDILDYRLARVIADEEMVALHGVYRCVGTTGFVVAFDVFRIAAGKLAEHWTVRQPVVYVTRSGRTQFDGPTEVIVPEQTEVSRAIVVRFLQNVVFGGKLERIAEFIDERFAQHNPDIADGIEALHAALGAAGIPLRDPLLRYTVAEGEFVLTMSEALRGDTPIVFYDLYRVAGDKIVEHWDVIHRIPVTYAGSHS
ncbi:hypothetical protein OG203_36830 [Nocardia sp. NBC_01499]|uniref:hypothetical protein n=1 Tax=Nocardia sp. NBC_01499 TaxID=2903597 RepID=UPI003865CF7B